MWKKTQNRRVQDNLRSTSRTAPEPAAQRSPKRSWRRPRLLQVLLKNGSDRNPKWPSI